MTSATMAKYRQPSMRRRQPCRQCGRFRRCRYAGRCDSCYRGQVPLHAGACLGGCGWSATGTRGGYCKVCYMALWRRTRLFREVAETDLAIMAVSAALDREVVARSPIGRAALRAAGALIDGVLEGRVVLHLNRQRNARRLALARPETA